MIAIFYLLVPVLFSVEWLSQKHLLLPPHFTLIPDLFSILVALIIMARVSTGRRLQMPMPYWILVGLLVVVMVGGLVINTVEPLVMIMGLRSHLKFLPFFLLPVVYHFSEEQIRRLLILILGFALLQLPVVIFQRFILYANETSGDSIGGSLGLDTSGLLSVILCCSVGVLMGFYAKQRIRIISVIALSIMLLLPTGMNETKVSLLIIPFLFMAPLLLSVKDAQATKRILAVSVVLGVVISGFIFSYDYFISVRRSETLMEFYSDPERVESYVYRGASSQYERIGRADSLILAVKTLSREGKLIFGVGIGNASLGPTDELTGAYYRRYWRMQPTKVFLTKILWELGVVGPLLYFALMGCVVWYAMGLRQQPSIVGALATGWVPVTVVLAASFLYFKTFDRDILICFFWFFSGYLASEAARLTESTASAGTVLEPTASARVKSSGSIPARS